MPRSPSSVSALDSQSSGKNGPPPCAIAPRSPGSSAAVMAETRGVGSSSSQQGPGGLLLAAYAGRPQGPLVSPQSPSGSRGPPATPGPGQLRPGVVPGGISTGSPPVRPDSARSPSSDGARIPPVAPASMHVVAKSCPRIVAMRPQRKMEPLTKSLKSFFGMESFLKSGSRAVRMARATAPCWKDWAEVGTPVPPNECASPS